jgi:Fic family protein
MRKSPYKQLIEENKKVISELLSGDSLKRLNSLNWLRHELSVEAEVLIQLPDSLQPEKRLFLDYNNIKNLGDAYRVSDVYSEQLKIHSPVWRTVIYKMDDIEYNLVHKHEHHLNKALNVHYDLIALQPFNDFNKRTARLIMNWYLIQNGYRPILFNKKSDRRNYMEALRLRADGDCKAYSKYMYECMLRTQKGIIKLLKDSRAF